ncbi:MAG: hypothetical protein D8M61_09840 [Ignavibacteriae bacterium]|nr:hypothetical protein [Ignavibacteriota bacterium]
MKHIVEDTLLKYQLELLEGEELVNVKNHLTLCETCRLKLDKIKSELELISSYDPEVEDVHIPIAKKRRSSTLWLRRAAVLLVGFVSGYSTSLYLQPDQVVVVSQYLNTNKTNISFDDYTFCPSVDIYPTE